MIKNFLTIAIEKLNILIFTNMLKNNTKFDFLNLFELFFNILCFSILVSTSFIHSIIMSFLVKSLLFVKCKFFNYKNYMYIKFFGNPQFPLATPKLFFHVLKTLEQNSQILDFGCGNGICYLDSKNLSLIKKLNIKITGIDIDTHAINILKNKIKKENLSHWINVQSVNIFENNFKNKFNYVIASESAPMLTNNFIIKLITYIKINLLHPNGKIIFINNIDDDSSKVFKFLKPKLKYFTGVDFGRSMTKQDFQYICEQTNTNLKFSLIEEMTVKSIAKFYKIKFIYDIFHLFGFSNYKVCQYKIILD